MPAVLYRRRSIPGASFLQVTASWPGVALYCATCGRDVVPLATFPTAPSVEQLQAVLRVASGDTARHLRAARMLLTRGVAREFEGQSYGGTE